jgi:hypothetical protein
VTPKTMKSDAEAAPGTELFWGQSCLAAARPPETMKMAGGGDADVRAGYFRTSPVLPPRGLMRR